MARVKQKAPSRMATDLCPKTGRKLNPKTGKCVRRFRPGTRALMEVRKQQKLSSVNFANSFAPMNRIIRDIASKQSDTVRFSQRALCAIIEAAEEVTVDILSLANYLAIEIGGRKGVSLRDFRIATRFCLYPHTLKGDLQAAECVGGEIRKREEGELPPSMTTAPLLSGKQPALPQPVAAATRDDDDIDQLTFDEDGDF